MALKLAHMISTSGMQPAPFVPRSAPPALIIKDGAGFHSLDRDSGEPDRVRARASSRTRIWEFGTNLHCSIIGTCLSTAALRDVLEKLKVNGATVASDHELHSKGWCWQAGARAAPGSFRKRWIDGIAPRLSDMPV
jgi:hypothetical protein